MCKLSRGIHSCRLGIAIMNMPPCGTQPRHTSRSTIYSWSSLPASFRLCGVEKRPQFDFKVHEHARESMARTLAMAFRPKHVSGGEGLSHAASLPSRNRWDVRSCWISRQILLQGGRRHSVGKHLWGNSESCIIGLERRLGHEKCYGNPPAGAAQLARTVEYSGYPRVLRTFPNVAL